MIRNGSSVICTKFNNKYYSKQQKNGLEKLTGRLSWKGFHLKIHRRRTLEKEYTKSGRCQIVINITIWDRGRCGCYFGRGTLMSWRVPQRTKTTTRLTSPRQKQWKSLLWYIMKSNVEKSESSFQNNRVVEIQESEEENREL